MHHKRYLFYLFFWMALGVALGLARASHPKTIDLEAIRGVAPETLSIGIQNKNPGNIRAHGKAWKAWKGAVGVDPWAHIVFKSDFHGLRAIRLNLEAYGRRGIDTPRKVAETWISKKIKTAEQRDYLIKICRRSGFGPDDKIDLSERMTLIRLTQGIVYGENGTDPYSQALYDRAFPVR